MVHDNRPLGIELDDNMPSNYHNIHLFHNWFATGKEKRGLTDQKCKHRKTHWKIAFLDLSKTIASRWATLEETDPETKIYCDMIANVSLAFTRKRSRYVWSCHLIEYLIDMSTLILSNHVQVYKASLNDAQTNSLPSSFSSGTSSSPTFNLSPVSASQTSLSMMAMPNLFIYGGQDSRPCSTRAASSLVLTSIRSG